MILLKEVVLAEPAKGLGGGGYQLLTFWFEVDGTMEYFSIVFELGVTPQDVALGLRDCAMKLADGPE